jgi:alpha-ketoglutarate-dependent dioxygenase FTO
MGKVSVSWHADSSLELNSSIGVYHCLPTQKRTARWDWRIALRRTPDSGADAKEIVPIAVPTKDGDAYFLLGRFNESHQHCVLAGSEATRISSTHRVAVTQEDTYDYILRRVKGGSKRFRLELQKSKNPSDIDPRVVVHCQKILTQVESEWIAQYWLQGVEHDKMHVWWQKPMKTLEAYWSILEELTGQLFQIICQQNPAAVKSAVIEGFLEELKDRKEQREKWDERRAEKIYQRRITPPFRPVARPVFEDEGKTKGLGKDLTSAIDKLSQILSSKTEEQDSRKTAAESSTSTKKKKRKKDDLKSHHDEQHDDDDVVQRRTPEKQRVESSSSSSSSTQVHHPTKKVAFETKAEGTNGKGGKKKKKRRKT